MVYSFNIYEIESREATLHGIMLRGRIRKFTVENKITCLIENASDKENVVRFAIIEDTQLQKITDFIKTLLPDASIKKVLENVQNPVLSKLKVNDSSRYGN